MDAAPPLEPVQEFRGRTFLYAHRVKSYELDNIRHVNNANYALRLENEHCAAEEPAHCDAIYFDPHHMYTRPPLAARRDFRGGTLTEDGALPPALRWILSR